MNYCEMNLVQESSSELNNGLQTDGCRMAGSAAWLCRKTRLLTTTTGVEAEDCIFTRQSFSMPTPEIRGSCPKEKTMSEKENASGATVPCISLLGVP
jgi:hypothetical protein